MEITMIFGHLLEDLTDGVTVFQKGVGKPMPLTSTDIAVEITSGLAMVVTTRKFSNLENVPIEVILTMPIGFNAVLTGLSARIDGRNLRAVAKPKDAARDSYEAALDAGKMAVLHEEVLRGIHVLSVGQLAPGKEVEVELRMTVPLSMSGGGPFLRLPMTAGQLYGSTPLQPADDLITSDRVCHEATLTVRSDTGVPRLMSHGPVAPGATINVTLDHALEILVEGGRFGIATGISAGGRQVRIDMRPQQTGQRNLRLAILVDRSGSTSSTVGDGTQTVLAAMRTGLAEALSDIHDEDHIALWQFSDECQRLGTGRGAEVLQAVKKLNRPSGGTRLGAAIRKVAASGIQDILVLTDGQTWETLPSLASELDIRISAVLVGKAGLDANIGHLCAMTGGDLFYAPHAEVGPSVRLALNAKRAAEIMREIALSDGRPSWVRRNLGGVEIVATWSEATKVKEGTDVGRFASWLCLGQIDEDAAAALALMEGLCTHATSLILVDEAGEGSFGLSETRKIPLMEQAAPELLMAMRSEPQMRFMRQAAIPNNGDRTEAKEVSVVQRTRLRPALDLVPKNNLVPKKSLSKRLRAFLNMDADATKTSTLQERKFDLQVIATIAQGIDWDTQINRFLSGDFAGLLQEEAAMLQALADDAAIAEILRTAPCPHKRVLLAWLAKQFVTHSRAAQRFSKKVMGQVSGRDIAQEIQDQVAH